MKLVINMITKGADDVFTFRYIMVPNSNQRTGNNVLKL